MEAIALAITLQNICDRTLSITPLEATSKNFLLAKRSGPVVLSASSKGEISKRPTDADCKSAGVMPSQVRILFSPPLLEKLRGYDRGAFLSPKSMINAER